MPVQPTIPVVFFRLDSGKEPVREWLKTGIARTFSTMHAKKLVLLHGFIKKSQKTPARELAIAKRRLNRLRAE